MSDAPIARRVLERMRRQVRAKVQDIAAFRTGQATAAALQDTAATPETLKGVHPAFALYAYCQNQLSVMAELLLALPEMQVFTKVLAAAHEDYMPSWPPMSPISTAYFWGWATLDVCANAHRETLGSVTHRVAAEFGTHPDLLTLMQAFNDSRMGVYRLEGQRDALVTLRDLVMDQECVAVCESGYRGEVGELWFTRVLPPIEAAGAEHVIFTSPYVLIEPCVTAWTEYLQRVAAQAAQRARREALARHFRWGPTRRYWPEFVFEGYVNHQPGAIFLKGLPDVSASRPHSKDYVGPVR